MTLGSRQAWPEPAHQEVLRFRPMDNFDRAYIQSLKEKETEKEFAILEDVG